MELLGKTTINPILFYSGKISAIFIWIVPILLILKINIINTITFGYHNYISFIIMIIGSTFVVLSLFNLGKSTRMGLPSKNTVLKTHGLYHISRNPLYVGTNLLTISALLYSLNFLIILIGIYSLIIHHIIILEEERFLENRFGLEYENYKKKTNRYI